MDSLSGETEVPDSQEIFADVVEWDAADALLCMASTDVSKELHDKELDAAASVLLPVFLPCMYGSKDEISLSAGLRARDHGAGKKRSARSRH